MPVPTDPSSTAERLFADWLGDRSAGGGDDLEELCREHPEQAERLRALRADWERIRAIVRRGDGEVSPPEGQQRAELLARLVGCGDAATRYRVEGEIGRGAMGAVLRVTDANLGRPLAMKVALGADGEASRGAGGHLSVRRLARFLEEAEVTGRLDHPGVVPVHELGLDAEGRVYFTMKLVEGRTLRQVLDELARGEGGWTQTRVLDLLLKVCDAMAYAHAKGVIHRDLKPSNVMVGRFGEVYVMDWGLAKVLGREDGRDLRIRGERVERREVAGGPDDSPLVTMDGDVVGTPAYMSPEQAEGRVADMGPHSDVYAVGAMLYHLLAGHMPYARGGESRTSHEVWRRVCEGPPRGLDDEAPAAPPELAAICARAMARDRVRRYEGMGALAEDLRAFLEHRVVQAYRTGGLAELGKWVERNRLLAGTLAAAGLGLVIGVALYVLGVTSAQRETEAALLHTRAIGLASASYEALGEDPMLALLLAREAARIESEPTPETLSRVHQALGTVRERSEFRHGDVLYDAVFSPSGDALVTISRLSGLLWDLGGRVTRLDGHTGWLTRVAFSTSGEEILTASWDGTARLWSLDGETLERFDHRPGGGTFWITAALSPGGRRVLTAAEDGTARIWDRDRPDEPPLDLLPAHTAPIRAATFSPDGKLVLTASEDRTARLYRLVDQGRSVELVDVLATHEGPITCASFSADGALVLTASGRGFWGPSKFGEPDHTARVWDWRRGESRALADPSYELEWAVFAGDGRRIVTGSNGDGGRLWDPEGKRLQDYGMPRSNGLNWMCSSSPDGSLVAFPGEGGSSYLFDGAGDLLAVLSGHDHKVLTARFSPDSRTLATASMDGTVRLWRVRDERLPAFRGHQGAVRAAYSPDGQRIATAAGHGSARIWDARGEGFVPLVGHDGDILGVAFDREGERVVTASMDGTARIWDLEGTELAVLHHEREAMGVRTAGFSPDGTKVVTGCGDGRLELWSTDGARLDRIVLPDGYSSWVAHVEFAPEDNGRVLVVKPLDPVLLLTLADHSFRALGRRGSHATFATDGRILIAGQDGGAALVTETGESVHEFRGHETALNWAAISRSGSEIVTAGRDGVVRLWRVEDETLEAELRGHEGVVYSAEFSPSGERVLTGGGDGTARTWLTDTQALLELAGGRSARDFSADELLRYGELLDLPAREARALVDELRDELVLKERVLERLREDRGLDERLRETALRMVAASADSAWDLYQRAQAIAFAPGRTEEVYARGLRLAAAACELRPDARWLTPTLGAALYRAGRLEEARATLERADREHEPGFGDRRVVQLYLAMTDAELGRGEEAQRLLGLAREASAGAVSEAIAHLLEEAAERIER